MIPAFDTPPGHRSVGPVAAYKRAVLSLWGVLTVAYVMRMKVFAALARTPEYTSVHFHLLPPRTTVFMLQPGLSRAQRQARERFLSQWDAFAMWYPEYLVTRGQFEPILAFLVIGAVVALVARYRRPFEAWLNDAQLV